MSAWRPGNPYCSPVLVRKKAIRSKVLRSGAYRDCGADAQLHQPLRDAGECRRGSWGMEGKGHSKFLGLWGRTGDKGAPAAAAGCESKGARSLTFLPDNEGVLAESVWGFAGIARSVPSTCRVPPAPQHMPPALRSPTAPPGMLAWSCCGRMSLAPSCCAPSRGWPSAGASGCGRPAASSPTASSEPTRAGSAWR